MKRIIGALSLIAALLAIMPLRPALADASCSNGGSVLASTGVTVPNFGQVDAITLCGFPGYRTTTRYAEWNSNRNYSGSLLIMVIGGNGEGDKQKTADINTTFWTDYLTAPGLTAAAYSTFTAADRNITNRAPTGAGYLAPTPDGGGIYPPAPLAKTLWAYALGPGRLAPYV